VRSGSGRPAKSAQSTAARSRRSLPDVACGARSQQPVGSAGGVAALSITMAPATRASAGHRCRLAGAKTHGRTAPTICWAVKGSPSTGQRSRETACRGAPVNGSEVFKRSGSSKRGAWRSTVLKVGAPGGASEQTTSSQNAACRAREVGPRRRCQVAWRSGGVAAMVRPVSVRGRGRTSAPRTGVRPFPC
jgi:hypothetical protein